MTHTHAVWKEHGKLAGEYDELEIERLRSETKRRNDLRTPFEKDRDRIIHCAAFRRLQGKTQVFGMGGSDFFRTRLTHSLETAQIGKGIALFCGHANIELVEAACLAHDIGHPPFGHTGEDVLKELMRKKGGFEGNAQNIRILNELEIRSADTKPGLNITRATFDAILKYKVPYSKINKSKPLEDWKFYYDNDRKLVEWACSGKSKRSENSFESEIMNWADDIAYSTHDLEDGIKAGMISGPKITAKIERNVKDRVKKKGLSWSQTICDGVYDKIEKASADHKSEIERKGKRRDLISHLIHSFITSSRPTKRKSAQSWSRYEFELVTDPKQELECNILKSLVWELIINDERVATLQRKARTIIGTLFDEFTKFGEKERTKEMYPADFREKLEQAGMERSKRRIACDYIAGMTDDYATRMYSRLRESEASSLLEVI